MSRPAQNTKNRGSDHVGSRRSWDALRPPLSPWILEAVSAMGFQKMTPVQASTIPLFMTHKDVVVEAVTGSGKTLAFLIPLVEKILSAEEPNKKHHVAAIVISPTRELASQIYSVLQSLLAFHGASAAALAPSETGTSAGSRDTFTPQDVGPAQDLATAPKVVAQLLLGGSNTPARDLSTFLKLSPNLLVSTPGRLIEILSSPYVHCPQASFEMLVLDEADRLLDLGFKPDLTRILNLLPKQRRTGLFSASVSEAVDQIIRVGLRNPVKIAVKVKSSDGVEDKRTPASLQMTYLLTSARQKFPALRQLLHKLEPTPMKTIVYLSTCAAVDYFQNILSHALPRGMILVPLHGKYPANVRQKNFFKFTESAFPALLLTTDVAARGLDIPAVDLVVQVDPPSDPKVFLHRCGRAGRAGRKGLSVIMLEPGREEDYISFLEVRQTPIEKLKAPQVLVDDADAEAMTDKIRKLVLTDRALHDKAQRAFVSWVRSYSKHQASSIFRVSDLRWLELAEGWGLLKMPKMPELKGLARESFPHPEMDWDTYAYKDKQRESQRKAALADFKLNGPPARDEDRNKKRSSSTAWSQKQDEKAHREVKRSQRGAKREYERREKMTEAEKERQTETDRMIEAVRAQQLTANDTFEGFD